MLPLLLLVVLACVVIAAVQDTSSLMSYPVFITATAFLLTGLAVLPTIPWRRPARAALPGAVFGRTAGERRRMVRIIAFCAVWLIYVALLNRLGFVLASSLALVASLWITLGTLRPIASAGAVVFVLALAILITTVLFVPVPKAGVDHWIDETIFTVMEK
ncbi:hypothetical protein C1H69_13040 [Billgrantia endophytica]|uniref:Tripartite tricarboxylate transporter TctB family protein n=2 Tax=Billgrantia endophytica TaxID=2033802 RepID=A0A2N7U2X0_9GAMM|nr:hypothetical protein C1H69_13040 [Halomonas endophytica]